jgi:hypothetical protein
VRIDRCNNIEDFRSMARRRLPGPIFHYIDGAADDEVTYRRNTEAYERCDLVPNVLAGVEIIDMSVTVMGQKLDMPLFCSPTALPALTSFRLFPRARAGRGHRRRAGAARPTDPVKKNLAKRNRRRLDPKLGPDPRLVGLLTRILVGGFARQCRTRRHISRRRSREWGPAAALTQRAGRIANNSAVMRI